MSLPDLVILLSSAILCLVVVLVAGVARIEEGTGHQQAFRASGPPPAAAEAIVGAALARVAAGETTAEEECLGVGRTFAEVRAIAEGELRAWQSLGEGEDASVAG